jgi:hypothetical protein
MDHTRNFVMTQRPAGLFPAIKRLPCRQGTGADELPSGMSSGTALLPA